MIKFVAFVQNLEQLEVLIDASKPLSLAFELGVVPAELPQRRKAKGKRSTKKKAKRRSGYMEVRVAPMSTDAPARVVEAREALLAEFGTKAFQKRLAIGVLQNRMKLRSRPTGYVAQLLDAGGLVAAV